MFMREKLKSDYWQEEKFGDGRLTHEFFIMVLLKKKKDQWQ
jgi:hypothetical protein